MDVKQKIQGQKGERERDEPSCECVLEGQGERNKKQR